MRSTVSDSSGNPENGQDPAYGEERYGAVPVREWVGPGGAGSVTDAWAAAADDRSVAESRTFAPGPDPVADLDPVAVEVPVRVEVAHLAGAGAGAGAEAEAEAEREAGREAGRGADAVPGVSAVSDVPAVSGVSGAPAVSGVSGVSSVPGVSGVSGVSGDGGPVRSGPDSVVDLVLDLVPAEDDRKGSAFGATSASVSVPATGRAVPDAGEPEPVLPDPVTPDAKTEPLPLPLPDPEPDPEPDPAPEAVLVLSGAGNGTGTGAETEAGTAARVPGPDAGPRTDSRWDTGRHQAVIANERTASIPVHLLFRDDPETGADAAALPAAVVRPAAGSETAPGVRRPPVPRSPQVRPSTRPSPDADPRLHERPGPALPGWVALLTGLVGTAAAGGVLWWTGAVPARVLSRLGLGPRPYDGLGAGAWAALAVLTTVVLLALGGLSRGRVGYAWVLTLFGQYRGTVRRTGLMWVSPLLLRRRVDVRLRHWRSEPLPAMDANGTALRVVVLVVWRVKDTVRATLGIEDHEEYLREQVESAMARVLSQLPADAFHEDAHTLRNAEAVGDALTRMLKADCEPVGIEVYSAQPTGIEYAPEVAAAMQRRRIAAIDAKHRDSVLTSVVDAVDDTVNRLTARGLVALDDYERKSLVKDLTVAFYTGRTGGDSA